MFSVSSVIEVGRESFLRESYALKKYKCDNRCCQFAYFSLEMGLDYF